MKQKCGQHLDPIFDASWRPTWFPRPSQNPPKIEQKSMKNGPRNHLYFLNPTRSQSGTILVQLLGHLVPTWPNLVPTWAQHGSKRRMLRGMVGPKIVQKSIKLELKSGNLPQMVRRNPETIPSPPWTSQKQFFG